MKIKSIIAAVAAIGCAIGMSAFSASASVSDDIMCNLSKGNAGIEYDINGDGIVSVADAVKASKGITVSLNDVREIVPENADYWEFSWGDADAVIDLHGIDEPWWAHWTDLHFIDSYVPTETEVVFAETSEAHIHWETEQECTDILVSVTATGLITSMLSTETEPAANNLYSLTGIVREVNYDTDIVSVEDYNGNIWQFYGCEDWMPNDCCSMIMDSKGTSNVEDDKIVSIRYCAWNLSK